MAYRSDTLPAVQRSVPAKAFITFNAFVTYNFVQVKHWLIDACINCAFSGTDPLFFSFNKACPAFVINTNDGYKREEPNVGIFFVRKMVSRTMSAFDRKGYDPIKLIAIF